MLTSLFYYGYYKPYFVKEADSVRTSKPAPRLSSDINPAGKSVLLNKAFKGDVIDYATNIYKKVVKLKDAVKYVSQSIDGFHAIVDGEGAANAKNWLTEDIEGFTELYNAARDFAGSQEHSARIKYFAQEQEDFIAANMHSLRSLGITADADGRLGFNKETVSNADLNDLEKTLEETGFVFDTVYQNTCDLLKLPISNHMNFRNLGYYYNYKLGAVQDDTFKIIESGMIVDLAV